MQNWYSLYRVRRTWERLARKNYKWAILTDSKYLSTDSSEEDFYETGRSDVADCIMDIDRLRPSITKESALDFGCGVGRLTYALAKHFQTVTGVDVAAPMLERACSRNTNPDRISFVKIGAPEQLKNMELHYDFVISLITLQHIPPPLQYEYIGNLFQLVNKGGIFCLQLLTEKIEQPSRFSIYPPTVYKRVTRWLRHVTTVGNPMEMHATTENVLVNIVEKFGGKVIFSKPHNMGKGVVSRIFYIAR